MKSNFLFIFLAIFAVVVLAYPASNNNFDELVKRQEQPSKTLTSNSTEVNGGISIPLILLELVVQYGAKYVDYCRQNSCKTSDCHKVICDTLPDFACCSWWCPVTIHNGHGGC